MFPNVNPLRRLSGKRSEVIAEITAWEACERTLSVKETQDLRWYIVFMEEYMTPQEQYEITEGEDDPYILLQRLEHWFHD